MTRSLRRAGGSLLAALMALVALIALMPAPAWSHDAISSEARKAYVAKLDELQRGAASGSPAARAAALIETGKLLDEIRSLLNEDIISHGKIQGLETTMLVSQLNATPYKFQQSPQTRLILADLRPWREALTLEPKGAQAALARYRVLKNHFYDSFVDNPLKPIQQSKETLLDMIGFGEGLLNAKHAEVDSEEVHFILAIHYLQAAESGAVPKAKCQQRVQELVRRFRSSWPNSLKLATLDALANP
jgi:hypothetical protein